MKNINVDTLYSDTLSEFNQVILNRNYNELLALYNRKSLPVQISDIIGLSNGDLPDMVVRLAKGEQRDEITNALKKYFGNFASHIA